LVSTDLPPFLLCRVRDLILYKCKEARDAIKEMSDKAEAKLNSKKTSVADTP
jgi:hypothetical protein